MKIAKDTLSLAGEYAVASELCRRGNYAQLTLAQRKRIDLLLVRGNRMLRVQVKTKQNLRWPLVKGVFGEDVLVFVDYAGKKKDERPDFYVLTSSDWIRLLKSGWGDGRYKLDERNVPVHISEDGDANWKGISPSAEDIQEFKEKWETIEALLGYQSGDADA